MKPVLCLLFALGACSSAWADVQIEYKGVTGATSTMFSNGNKVRINRIQVPGYVLFDGETEDASTTRSSTSPSKPASS